MSAIYYVLAFAAGLGITLQTTLNSQLAKGLEGDPVTAALFSFTAGALSLGVYSATWRGFHRPCCHPFTASVESGERTDRCLCVIQLCGTCTKNRFFSPARVGDCRSSQVIDHFGLLGAI